MKLIMKCETGLVDMLKILPIMLALCLMHSPYLSCQNHAGIIGTRLMSVYCLFSGYQGILKSSCLIYMVVISLQLRSNKPQTFIMCNTHATHKQFKFHAVLSMHNVVAGWSAF